MDRIITTVIKILNDYDWDFCQVQYNYLDEVTQAGVKGVKAAAEKAAAEKAPEGAGKGETK